MLAPIVFAGISVSIEEAERLSEAEVRPPIKRGDLDQLNDGNVVVIIGGELNESSVAPIDEIIRALHRGVKISGAASLGAVRAHEACAEGMVGHGWVYDAYCAGRIMGTDEIEVFYDPDSYRPLTVPLVNVRFCLDHLAERGGISAEEIDRAMASLKELDIGERDRRNILLHLTRILGQERITKALKVVSPADTDIKRRDAEALLRILRKGGIPWPP